MTEGIDSLKGENKMARERTTQDTSQTAQTTVQETPELKRLNQLGLQRAEAGQEQALGLQQAGGSLVTSLLTGQPLPGYLESLPGGISESATSRIVQGALEDVRPGLQKSGLLDSGIRAELETETAADIRAQSEQFNIQNLMQLLNVAFGGQASNQQAALGQSGQLAQSLAGLRGQTATGSSEQTKFGANPFLKSFQQSFGKQLGQTLKPSSEDVAKIPFFG